jgi:hypothetical protein
MIKEIYEDKKYSDGNFTEKVKQFAKHLYEKYPDKQKIDDQILLEEAKVFKMKDKETKYAINLMLKVGDAYIVKDYIGIVK